MLSLLDDNSIRMARKPRKNRKENSVVYTGDGKGGKFNTRKGSREGKTGTIFGLSLEVRKMSHRVCLRFHKISDS